MNRARQLLGASILLLACSHLFGANREVSRALSDEEVESVISALLKDPTAPLSEDPSCKADLSAPGSMSIAEGLAVALVRAATERKSVVVRADCAERPGFPLDKGQELCRLTLLPEGLSAAAGYGLIFVMDWPKGAAVSHSVECF